MPIDGAGAQWRTAAAAQALGPSDVKDVGAGIAEGFVCCGRILGLECPGVLHLQGLGVIPGYLVEA